MKILPVLVAYEESGKVTAALRARGVEAFSNDLLETRGNPDWHIRGDALDVIYSRKWGGIIAHPVCTNMANSGSKHLYMHGQKANGKNMARWAKMTRDAHEFRFLIDMAPTDLLVIENPIMHEHAKAIVGRDQDQVVQPWWFGHQEMKATCLWQKNLPLLRATEIVGPPPKDPIERRTWAKVHRCPPGPLRQRIRSETCQGLADALADQYAPYFLGEKQ